MFFTSLLKRWDKGYLVFNELRKKTAVIVSVQCSKVAEVLDSMHLLYDCTPDWTLSLSQFRKLLTLFYMVFFVVFCSRIGSQLTSKRTLSSYPMGHTVS